jgi:hypothetical protein
VTNLDHTAVSTLGIAVSWVGIGLVIAGCGLVTRRALLTVLSYPAGRSLSRVDLWIGLGALTVFVQAWGLFWAVTWEAWLVPVAVGAAGLILAVWASVPMRISRPPVRVLLPLGIGVLWLANRSLAQVTDYDFGLYHLAAIDYSAKFGAIPGLGNLQDRLGAGNAHLLLAAFLGHGPWSGAGFRLANGLLASMLFVDIASRFAGARFATTASMTRRMALLLVPATVMTIGKDSGYRLSSANLDFAVFVLVAVGALYLAEYVERGPDPATAVTCATSLALASVTRPVFWLTFAAAGAFVAVRGRRDGGRWRPLVRPASLALVLPVALAVGWAGRQAVLSGYPLFPTTIGGLPVDWRVPASVVDDMNRWTRSWARWPGRNPDDVLGSWAWLRVWLHHRKTDHDVIWPLLLLGAALPALVRRSARDLGARRVAMLAVLAPMVITLVVWFVTAPDPRFVLGPLWLVPIAVVAWALPVTQRGSPGLTTPGRWLPVAAVVVAVLGPIAGADRAAFHLISSGGPGPFATAALPTPAVVPFRTESGLQLTRPAAGEDRCFGVMLCLPKPDRDLRLRGAGSKDGFATSGPSYQP